MLTVPAWRRAGDLAAGARVARPDAGVQAVVGVVGARDHLVDGGAAVDGRDRTEGLVAAQRHVLGDAGQQRGLVEVGAEVGAGAPAGQHLGALGDGVVDVAGDLRELVGAAQRAHVGAEVEAGAEAHVAQGLGEARHEGVVDGVVHVEALDADAELAAVGADAAHGAADGGVEVGVGQHEQRVLAAELHRAVLEAAGGLRRDGPAGGRRAGEHQVVGGVDERLAELAAASRDDLQQVARQAGLVAAAPPPRAP